MGGGGSTKDGSVAMVELSCSAPRSVPLKRCVLVMKLWAAVLASLPVAANSRIAAKY
jgi:hypothetical protein